MTCIYCGEKFHWDDMYDIFKCDKCKAQLKIFQHPDARTISGLDNDFAEYGYDRSGIATQYIRGNI